MNETSGIDSLSTPVVEKIKHISKKTVIYIFSYHHITTLKEHTPKPRLLGPSASVMINAKYM